MNHNGANTKVYIRQIKSRRLKVPALCFMKPNAKKQVILTKNRAAALYPFQPPPELQQRLGRSPGSGLYIPDDPCPKRKRTPKSYQLNEQG